MPNQGYRVYNNDFDRGEDDGYLPTVSVTAGGSPQNFNMEGVLVPYENIVDTSQVKISYGGIDYYMNQVETAEVITLGADNTEINTSLNTYGNIIPAFTSLYSGLGIIPPFIATHATISEYSWVNQTVIVFRNINEYFNIIYPSHWSPIPNFNNSYHYLWYIRKECFPDKYYMKLTNFAKSTCA